MAVNKILFLSAVLAAANAGLVSVTPAQYSAASAQYSTPPAQYSAASFQHSANSNLFSVAPAHYLAGPLQYSPAPVQYSPAPIQYSPAPVQYSPAPVQIAKMAPPMRFTVTPVSNRIASPVHHAPAITKETEDYDPNPQYTYEYEVQDGQTGDSKNHSEQRQGDAVQGSYSLVDPDGYRRTVDYTADPIHGFKAVVRRESLQGAHVAKVAVPAYAPAPSYHH